MNRVILLGGMGIACFFILALAGLDVMASLAEGGSTARGTALWGAGAVLLLPPLVVVLLSIREGRRGIVVGLIAFLVCLLFLLLVVLPRYGSSWGAERPRPQPPAPQDGGVEPS